MVIPIPRVAMTAPALRILLFIASLLVVFRVSDFRGEGIAGVAPAHAGRDVGEISP
jgi:hypothetical protein